MRASHTSTGWPGRHRIVLGLLVAGAALLSGAGLVRGWSPGHVLAELVLPLLGAAAIGRFARPRRIAEGAAAIGLMYASAVTVHLADGVTEAHFLFFVAFGLVALYRDWWVFFAAAGFAVAHHALLAVFGPQHLFAQPYQLDAPVQWAAVHVAFVTVVTAISAVGMYDVDRSVRRRTRAEAAARRAEERTATALRLHDDVVQALATANYAHELGQQELHDRALTQALASSRLVVRELLQDATLDEHLLRRPTPAPRIAAALTGTEPPTGTEGKPR